jgi:hypothetical protein
MAACAGEPPGDEQQQEVSVSALSSLARLEGRWVGTNNLWLSPDQAEARVSEATMTVTEVGQGRFVSLAYTWADEGKPQDGLLVIGYDEPRAVVTAYWLDSWHMGNTVMSCEGTVDQDGVVEVGGPYAAPPGPDWGWTIRIEPGDDSFRFLMYNVTPEGESALAVETVFSPVK